MTTKLQIVYGQGHRPYVIPAYNPDERQTITRIGGKK